LQTAKQLGERAIIEIIWKHLSRAPDMKVPVGDDVSAVKCESGTIAVLKTDMLVGRTDIPPQMNLWQAARKAVIMNVSDFAAKGAKPLGLMVSLGIPPDLTRRDIEQIAGGLDTGAREYGAYVLGGDTSETDDLIISVALFGSAEKKKLMLRSGVRPGDILATTGPFGLSASGLKTLIEKTPTPQRTNKKLLDAVLMPRARLGEGLALAEAGVVTASIDSSDGLAWSLYEISRASNVGFLIDKPPIASEASEFAETHHLDPVELAFYGGEEYELVVTVKPGGWRRAEKAVKTVGGRLIKVGKATKKKGILLRHRGEISEIEARGYEHFKQGGKRRND
jgi:thiamine-monophosphate kinase